MSIRKPVKRFFRRVWKTLRTLPTIILFGLGLVFAGVWLHETSDDLTKLAAVFTSELGFAFLIAAIIFGIFEEWAAREHGKTAMGHIYGVYPSGPFFDMIEEQVLKQKFYRSGVIVTYAFEEGEGEEVLLRQSIEYGVVNVCAREDEAEFAPAGRVDLKPLHTGDTKWDDKLGLDTLKIGGVLVSRDQIKFTHDKASRSQSWKWEKKIGLPYKGAKTYKGPEKIEASHCVVKHDHDSAVWTSTLPSTDIEFRITWVESLRLKVAMSAIHPELGTLTPEEGIRSLTVKLKVPFLKGHGIHFWWSPQTVEESAPVPQPAADMI